MGHLRQKTIRGLFWNTLDNLLSQGINLIVVIVLSRILGPEEFGIIAMTTIFVTIAQVFIDGGFTQALIRKQNCTNADYSTIFFFNILISIVIYILLFFLSPLIAAFFKEQALIPIIRTIALIIIIGALTVTQQAVLIKQVEFKIQAKISFISVVASGGISIYLAFAGFGIWALVWRILINQIVRSLLLWLYNKWIPELTFCWDSFKEMFGFSYKLTLIYGGYSIYNSVYSAIIGKNYNATVLGLYANASTYSNFCPSIISQGINKVCYPILAPMQNDDIELRKKFGEMLRLFMFLTFFISFTFMAIAEPLYAVVLREKWLPAVPYFQLLTLGYVAGPLHVLNQCLMNVKGKSNLFLKAEILRYLFTIPLLIIAIKYEIYVLLIVNVLSFWMTFLFNASYAGKLINYSAKQQLKSILFPLLSSLFIASGGFVFCIIYPFGNIGRLVLSIFIILILFFLFVFLVKHPICREIKRIISSLFNVKKRIIE
jgi:O-antigen/teichoic acid export membrane protein